MRGLHARQSAFQAIIRIAEDTAPALQLRDDRLLGSELIRTGPRRAYDVAANPLLEQPVAAVFEDAHRLLDLGSLLDRVGHLQEMPLVAHDSHHFDSGKPFDPFRQVEGVAARPDADAIQADVHFDDHATGDPFAPAHGCQRFDLCVVVAGDDRVGRPAERNDALELPRSDDHVSDQQVANAGRGHHLGFGNFRTRHADRTGRHLRQRDRRSLVAFHVRPPLLAARRR